VDFFLGNRVTDEGAETITPARSRVAAAKRAPEAPAAAAPAPAVVASAIPLPPARPAPKAGPAAPSAGFELASATSQVVRDPPPARPAQATSLVAQASLSATDVINERGYWQGLVEQSAAPHVNVAARTEEPPRPPAYIPEVGGNNIATGGVAPWPMPERRANGETLAYAPPNQPVSVATGPTGKARIVSRIASAPQQQETVAVKAVGAKPPAAAPAPATVARAASTKPADRLNDPWMRAMVLAPNAQEFMSTSLYGAADYQTYGSYLQKPAASVMMTFSDDPHLGMSSEKFRGHAVVFVATVTFGQRTAALQ
jgi:hypothetical protein